MRQDLTGSTFDDLTVVRKSRVSERREQMWFCLCKCGNSREVTSRHLTKGKVRNCGCNRKVSSKKFVTEELKSTYDTWCNMKQRCYYTLNHNYSYYGGRGITVCPRWLESFLYFLQDMGKKPPGASIDRINCDGNYCLENCRWATKDEQAKNKRNIVWVDFNDRKVSLTDYAKLTGIGYGAARHRYKNGKL